MHPSRFIFLIFAITLFLSLFSACTPDFDPRSEVKHLRILVIQPDSPSLMPGESANVNALVVSPEGELTSLSWEFCLAVNSDQNYRQCIDGSEFSGGAGGGGGAPPEGGGGSIQLPIITGEGDEFQVVYSPLYAAFVEASCEPPKELLEQLPSGFSLPSCAQEGMPAYIRLTAKTADDEITALKKIYLHPPSGSSVEVKNSPNKNPQIERFEMSNVGEEGAVSSIKKGARYELHCDVNEAEIETYELVRGESSESQKEGLLFSWFVIGGKLEKELTFFEEGLIGLDKAQSNFVTVDADAETLNVWCIIRDGRGGNDWKEIAISIAAP